jgi:hypothetical protein
MAPDEERALGGAFLVPFKREGDLRQRQWLRVIASSGADQPAEYAFDHLSVSLSNRCPTWEEMDYIKRLFFKPEEVAYQLHMPRLRQHQHASLHCLHIWRRSRGFVDFRCRRPTRLGLETTRWRAETAVNMRH